MYLHEKFIKKLIKFTEQGLDWEKINSNQNSWASPRSYKTTLYNYNIYVIWSPNLDKDWTKEYVEYEDHNNTKRTMSSKTTNIVAVITEKSKKTQTLIFNEVDPFDQIGFDLFKIIVHYNDPKLESSYADYVNKKLKKSKILVAEFTKNIKEK